MIDVTIDAILEGHKGPLYTAILSPENDYLLTAGEDMIVAKWDLANSSDAKMIAKATSTVYSICFFNENKSIAIGQRNGSIHLIDVENGKEFRQIYLDASEVFVLESVNNEGFISGNANGIISLWNKDGDLIIQKKISEKAIRSVVFINTRHEIVIGCSDNNIYVLNFSDLEIKNAFSAHKNSVFALSYVKSLNLLFSGSRDASLHVRDLDSTKNEFEIIQAHLFTVNSIVTMFSEKFIATASRDKEIRIWNLQDNSLVKVLNKEKFGVHSHSVNKLIWNETTSQLISVGDDSKIAIWNCKEMLTDGNQNAIFTT